MKPTKREILTATIESLEIWQKWDLCSERERCPLCALFSGPEYSCYRCPLSKIGDCCFKGNSSFNIVFFATQESDKQPLIEALEKATIYATLDLFVEKCTIEIAPIILAASSQ